VSVPAVPWSERADSCLATFDEAGQAIARRVVLRLVDFGEGRAETPRPQPLSALRTGDDPERFADTLRRLTQARLLTIAGDQLPDEGLVELAAEAPIASWPTLQAWIRAHGKVEQLRRQLETDAARWQQRADGGGLLDGEQLLELAGWLTADARRDIGVSEVADSFIAASRAATRRRWWPGKTSATSFLAVLLILMLLATPIVLLLIVVLAASVIHSFR
jgi:hypothetical protein